MKKWRYYIAFAILFVLLLPMTVAAHPGKTDDNKGHIDRSAGEYHYHHGYEAHQHYDMDGDGIKDCPYDFRDKTGVNSGDSSGGSSSGNADTNKNNQTNKAPSNNAGKEGKTATEILQTVIVCIFYGACIILLIWEFFGGTGNSKKVKEIASRNTATTTRRKNHSRDRPVEADDQ